MKTEATGTTTNTVDAQQSEETAQAAEAGAADSGQAAEAEPAAKAPKDSVEQAADEPAYELGGKDTGSKPKPDMPELNGGVDVEALRAQYAGTTFAEAEDLTGERGGKTTQIAEPETVGRDDVRTVKANDDAAWQKVAEKVSEGSLLLNTADTAQALSKDPKLLQATWRLGGGSDASKMIDFHKKLPWGNAGVKAGLGVVTVANSYGASKQIGHDIENGGLSTDSVVPAMDIASDLIGQSSHPLAKAWSMGWSLGRTFDNYTGTSDKASDLAAYGTTDPWAGTVQEGRANMRAYEKRSGKIRARILERHRAAQIRAEQREIGSTPKSAKEAPRLDASNTEVDSSGRVYVNGQYRGYYDNGRFIVVDGD